MLSTLTTVSPWLADKLPNFPSTTHHINKLLEAVNKYGQRRNTAKTTIDLLTREKDTMTRLTKNLIISQHVRIFHAYAHVLISNDPEYPVTRGKRKTPN